MAQYYASSTDYHSSDWETVRDNTVESFQKVSKLSLSLRSLVDISKEFEVGGGMDSCGIFDLLFIIFRKGREG